MQEILDLTAEEGELFQQLTEESLRQAHMRGELIFESPGCAVWARRTGPLSILSVKSNSGTSEAFAERARLGRIAQQLLQKGVVKRVPLTTHPGIGSITAFRLCFVATS